MDALYDVAMACLSTQVKVFVRRADAPEYSAAALLVTAQLSVADATALAIRKLRITTAGGNVLPADCATLKLVGAAQPLLPYKTLLLSGVTVESVLVLEVVRQPAHDMPLHSCGNPFRTLHTLGVMAIVLGLAGATAGPMASASSLLLLIAGSLAVQTIQLTASSGSIGKEAGCCCCSDSGLRPLLVTVCCLAPMELVASAVALRMGPTEFTNLSPGMWRFFFSCGVAAATLHSVLAVIFVGCLDCLGAQGRRGSSGGGALGASESTPLFMVKPAV